MGFNADHVLVHAMCHEERGHGRQSPNLRSVQQVRIDLPPETEFGGRVAESRECKMVCACSPFDQRNGADMTSLSGNRTDFDRSSN